ncbi:MAG: DUF1926 domain-containing protein [Thermoflexales bacterium]|nr:DUF1926 domain-containing protein [Thermoflexales bacterium]
MGKIHLSLAFHNHQPIGNFDWIFDDATRLAYEPMIAALERHPGVRLALHYTGPLRDWLVARRPDLLKRVRALVRRGQVEVMSGAYYEPVLLALPDADKLGQINKMTRAIQKDFAYQAGGAWLAERVWEPHLPKPLAEAGIQYTILDDTHFGYVGLSGDQLLGYYITEEQGHSIKIFPSLKYLRYALPWKPVSEIIDWLRAQADEAGTRVAVMGDDGEKFGLWPGSYEHCWKRCWDTEGGWVESFFTALEANADWLVTTPPGEYAAAEAPAGRVYLPAAAYDEMTEWALPAEANADMVELKQRLQDEGRDDVLRFLKGGIWRGFMTKYPEINTMHKKMLYVSDKVHRIKNRAARVQALDALWAGQCNCPYWHGLFGGIYLLHIREAAYERLIAAERLADAQSHISPAWAEAYLGDVDRDGRDEVILSNGPQSLTFAPAVGGVLLGWDWRGKGVNLVNTMTRRPEGYHRILRRAAERGELVVAGQGTGEAILRPGQVRVKEAGLETKLFYDWYRRASLVDHFMPSSVTLDEFSRCHYTEWGDFVDQPYTATITHPFDQDMPSPLPGAGADPNPERVVLALMREGYVWQAEQRCPLRLEKTISLVAGRLTLHVAYRLTNLGQSPISARFGVETNWGLSGGDGPQAYSVWPGGNLVRLNEVHATEDVCEAALVNEWYGRVIMHWEGGDCRTASWWQFPIETISNSESGFECVYQGTCVLTHWPLELAPGSSWETTLYFKLH